MTNENEQVENNPKKTFMENFLNELDPSNYGLFDWVGLGVGPILGSWARLATVGEQAITVTFAKGVSRQFLDGTNLALTYPTTALIIEGSATKAHADAKKPGMDVVFDDLLGSAANVATGVVVIGIAATMAPGILAVLIGTVGAAAAGLAAQKAVSAYIKTADAEQLPENELGREVTSNGITIIKYTNGDFREYWSDGTYGYYNKENGVKTYKNSDGTSDIQFLDEENNLLGVYKYDSSGRLITAIQNNKKYDYENDGSVAIVGTGSDKTIFTIDNSSGKTNVSVQKSGEMLNFSFDNVDGGVTATLANGVQTTMKYNSELSTYTTTDSDGNKFTQHISSSGNMSSERIEYINTDGTVKVKSDDLDGNGTADVTIITQTDRNGTPISKQKKISGADGNYDIIVYDPLTDAEIVRGHVDSTGNFKFTINGKNLFNASAGFKLPEWADLPSLFTVSNFGEDYHEYSSSDDEVTWEKTSNGFTRVSTNDSGEERLVVRYDRSGHPIDAELKRRYVSYFHISANVTKHDNAVIDGNVSDGHFLLRDDGKSILKDILPALDVPFSFRESNSRWNGIESFGIGSGSIEISAPLYPLYLKDKPILKIDESLISSDSKIRLLDNNTTLEITTGNAGDVLFIHLNAQKESAISGIYFKGDGVDWSISDLLQRGAQEELLYTNIYGSINPDILSAVYGKSKIIGNGGNDTYVYSMGMGLLEIEQVSKEINKNNILRLHGIDQANLRVSVSNNGTDLIIKDGVAGDEIVINRMMLGVGYGIQGILLDSGITLNFSDLLKLQAIGSVGNEILVGNSGNDVFDGRGGNDVIRGGGGDDVFMYSAGYGNLKIVQINKNPTAHSVLKLGNINLSSISVESTRDGNGIVIFDGVEGDSITIENMLINEYSGVQQLLFEDGSHLTRKQLIDLSRKGTSEADLLVGSSGDDVIDGAGGGDIYIGNGGNDVYIFSKGYGILDIRQSVTLNENISTLRIKGIDVSDIRFSSTYEGDSLLVSTGEAGDQIKISNMLLGNNNGIQCFEFDDGTIWSRDEILLRATTGSIDRDNIFGTSNADIIDGKGGDDIAVGRGGGDKFIFNRGYGELFIDEIDFSEHSANILKFGEGILASDVSVSLLWDHRSIVLNVGGNDKVSINSMILGNQYGVQEVHFFDGTIWSHSDIVKMQLSSGTEEDDAIYGTAGSDILDGKGGYDYVRGNGGGDTFIFESGYRNLLIDDVTSKSDADSTLLFGPGILAENINILISDDRHGLILRDRTNYDQVVIQDMLMGDRYGVQKVKFHDGTIWSHDEIIAFHLKSGTSNFDFLCGTAGSDVFDGKGGGDIYFGNGGGDVFIFNKGYGELTIDERDFSLYGNNVIRFGEGIMAQDITFSSHESGDLQINIGTDGDVIYVSAMLSEYFHGIQGIEFSDGTTLSKKEIYERETIGTPGDDTLYGSADSNMLDGKGGNDVSIGMGKNDVHIYNVGYGILDVRSNYGYNGLKPKEELPHNIIRLGEGISKNDVIFSMSSYNNGKLEFGGTNGKIIFSYGFLTGIQEVQFFDGSVLTAQEMNEIATTGTSSNDYLYGLKDHADVFDGKGGDDHIDNYYESNGDTYKFEKGYGKLEIYGVFNWNEGNVILSLGAGIDPGEIHLYTPPGTNDIILRTGQEGDQITLTGMANGYDRGVKEIIFSDGTVWDIFQVKKLASEAGNLNFDTNNKNVKGMADELLPDPWSIMNSQLMTHLNESSAAFAFENMALKNSSDVNELYQAFISSDSGLTKHVLSG